MPQIVNLPLPHLFDLSGLVHHTCQTVSAQGTEEVEQDAFYVAMQNRCEMVAWPYLLIDSLTVTAACH